MHDRTPEDRARAAAERAARRSTREPDDDAPLEVPEPEPEPEPDPRTATATTTRPLAAAVPPRRRGGPRPPDVTHEPARRRKRRAWGVRFFALLGLAAILGVLYLINETFQPFHDGGFGSVVVTVPSGVGAREIGAELENKGVVESGSFFNVNATLTARRGKLRPGRYTLQRNMSNGDAIEALIQGPKVKVIETFKVTIPEGLPRREIAPLIAKADVEGDYLKASADERFVRRARRYGLPRRQKTLEGFLFPATYDLVTGASARDLVDQQLDAYRDNLAEIDLRSARRRNLTRYDVLTIASMIEREAQLDEERPLIAAVIYNRLRAGMPLGIDATIRYAENNWTRPLKQSELDRDTPYNTRLRRGLPPTPIGNPGRASLEAAAKPARESYLYYVVKPGTCGEHAFSSTEAKFARDRARYEAERAKRGGQSPTDC